MNRALTCCIVGSLRVNGLCEEPLARLRNFGQPAWERTLSWLDDSGLALYLLKQIDRAGADNALPRPIRTRLQQNLASNRQRMAEMKREFELLNCRFGAAGVEFAVLKGFALVPDFCPDAALRLQYDFDYLVHPKCEKAARQILETAGYAQRIQSPGHEPEGATLFVSEPLSLPPADQDFYGAALPRRVELHLGLWEPTAEGVRLDLPEDFLDRKRAVESQVMRFPALADDDALLLQVLHAFHHMLHHWCRPSCFLEIAYFAARQYPNDSFWHRFCSRVGARRYLPEIVGLVFSMAATLFGAPVPGEVARWSARGSVLGLWVREYGERWAVAPFPGSKLSLFMHREFVADPGVWKNVRRSRLLPLHRPAHVAEAGGNGGASRWTARHDQWRFILGRVGFHVGALFSYGWHLARWEIVLRRASGWPNPD